MARPPAPPSRHARSLVLLALMTLLAYAPAVWAHSFGRTFASARYAERIDGKNLEVLVVVELPSLDVLGDFRRFLRDHPDASDEANTDAFRAAQLEDIASTFSLSLNGQLIDAAWRPVDHPANGLGDADFFVYMIEHRRPTPQGNAVEVELHNQLHPAKVVFMSSRAEAADGWRVGENSAAPILADGLDGEVVGPDVAKTSSDKWSSKESMRHLRVVFQRNGAPPSE